MQFMQQLFMNALANLLALLLNGDTPRVVVNAFPVS
jgi:hypothetical protein